MTARKTFYGLHTTGHDELPNENCQTDKHASHLPEVLDSWRGVHRMPSLSDSIQNFIHPVAHCCELSKYKKCKLKTVLRLGANINCKTSI